jgi:hypothetical protein
MKITLPKRKFLPFIWLYYPFTKEEIYKFKSIINWNLLSSNESIKWDYHLIKEFEDYWSWNIITDNISVFRNVSLHLLFTDKVSPINCSCERQLDNCDCVSEYDIWKLNYRAKSDKFFDSGYEEYESNLGKLKIITKQFIGNEQLKSILELNSDEDVMFTLN